MKKQGRSTDQALLRTAINKNIQTFSHKRLMKDLQEIQNETIPTVGVIARPLDHDIFTWHGNIIGPKGTLYEGGIFHIELKFPHSYPNHPPTVTLFNSLPHPNVFGNYICLDMIQAANGQKQEGKGWSSAYSVQSILTQLQSFLFQENLNKDKAQVQMEAKKAVKEANTYKCSVKNCKHGGKLSAWPQFSTKEIKDQDFSTLEDENDLIKKELICFHTKLNYNENQLGLGLKISKIPRTGNIRQGETYFDYISVKAFLKESMKFTSHNERITHWIPVYFGKEDNEQRFLHFLERSLSMIMTNSTKNFKPEFIIEVFPKLMITTIFYIMDEKKHASIRAIRILCHLHSMFLFSLKKHQSMQEKIIEEIQKFLENEDNRHKNVVANLGSILAKASAVDKFKFEDIAESYFAEQLDRQVLWILKAVPELLNEKMKEEADKMRSTTVFKTQMTSFHMFCFYKLFITTICEKRKSRQNLLDEYESNFCKLSNKEEDEFQQQILSIPKKVTSFKEFFSYVGLKQRSEEEISKLLHGAIKNSERKKYHGQVEVMYSLPSTCEQLQKLLSKVPSYDKYIKVQVQTLKQGENETYTYKIKQQKSAEQNWKQMCVDRWAWVREALSYDPSLDSQNISSKASQYAKEGISKPEDRLSKIIQEQYLNSKINYKEPAVKLPQTSWKKLFLRLDLEDFLSHIDMNPDFKTFYEKLEVCKFTDVNSVLITMIEINNIKSGYFYLSALLSKLTTLKSLEFTGLPQMSNLLNEKAGKALKKGFNNFKEAGGKLEIISFHNMTVNKDLSDCLFSYLSNADSINSLRFTKTNIFAFGNTMKVLANYLVNLKNVEELVFDQCSLDQEKCKILADSLMRMKNLKIFEIHDFINLGLGLSSIIYNLAFSPNLLKLDISRCSVIQTNEVNEAVISLQKLLKINSSIEVIKAKNIYNLNPSLSKDFWVALGECRTLRVLDLAFSGDLSQKKTEMGQAIAFNAKKKGSLQYLNINGSFNSNFNLNLLYTAMNVSEYDEESLYGDPNKLSKMIASNYKKAYYNNLKALQLDNCSNLNPSNFNLTHYNKLVDKKDPEYVRLFAQSPCLESLNFKSTNMQKNIAEVLVLALDPRRANFVSKIKVLNLSKNTLGKEGIKILAQVLPHNNILEVLDLSKNALGVSGAYELSVALKNNKTLKYLNLFNNKISYDGARAVAENIVANSPSLEFLEIGHNRIRDKGLKALVDAVIQNKQSALRVLCFRFNFITNSTAEYLINQITTKPNKLEEIFMRNNSLDDMGISNLYSLHEQSKSKVSIDILQKIKYLEQDKSDRTVWIHPIESINLQNLKKFFEIQHKCGIVLDLRVRKGKVYPGKKQQNLFGFVEFADETSVTRALHLAAKKEAVIDGVKFRVYKAGTGTFLFSKKSSKQKKLQEAQRLLPAVPYAITQALNSRGGVGARGRGGKKRAQRPPRAAQVDRKRGRP